MMVYEKHVYIMSLNPRAELVRLKTYLLGYVNIEKEIDTDVHNGEKLSVNGYRLNQVKSVILQILHELLLLDIDKKSGRSINE